MAVYSTNKPSGESSHCWHWKRAMLNSQERRDCGSELNCMKSFWHISMTLSFEWLCKSVDMLSIFWRIYVLRCSLIFGLDQKTFFRSATPKYIFFVKCCHKMAETNLPLFLPKDSTINLLAQMHPARTWCEHEKWWMGGKRDFLALLNSRNCSFVLDSFRGRKADEQKWCPFFCSCPLDPRPEFTKGSRRWLQSWWL